MPKIFNDKKLVKKINREAKIVAKELLEQYEQKNLAYGNNAHQGFLKYGPISYVIRIEDKLNRMETLLQHGFDPGDEALDDTLGDAITYCAMFIGSLYSTSVTPHDDNQAATREWLENWITENVPFYSGYSLCIFSCDKYDEDTFAYNGYLTSWIMQTLKNPSLAPGACISIVSVLMYRLMMLLVLLRVSWVDSQFPWATFFVCPKEYKDRFDYWMKENKEEK